MAAVLRWWMWWNWKLIIWGGRVSSAGHVSLGGASQKAQLATNSITNVLDCSPPSYLILIAQCVWTVEPLIQLINFRIGGCCSLCSKSADAYFGTALELHSHHQGSLQLAYHRNSKSIVAEREKEGQWRWVADSQVPSVSKRWIMKIIYMLLLFWVFFWSKQCVLQNEWRMALRDTIN